MSRLVANTARTCLLGCMLVCILFVTCVSGDLLDTVLSSEFFHETVEDLGPSCEFNGYHPELYDEYPHLEHLETEYNLTSNWMRHLHDFEIVFNYFTSTTLQNATYEVVDSDHKGYYKTAFNVASLYIPSGHIQFLGFVLTLLSGSPMCAIVADVHRFNRKGPNRGSSKFDPNLPVLKEGLWQDFKRGLAIVNNIWAQVAFRTPILLLRGVIWVLSLLAKLPVPLFSSIRPVLKGFLQVLKSLDKFFEEADQHCDEHEQDERMQHLLTGLGAIKFLYFAYFKLYGRLYLVYEVDVKCHLANHYYDWTSTRRELLSASPDDNAWDILSHSDLLAPGINSHGSRLRRLSQARLERQTVAEALDEHQRRDLSFQARPPGYVSSRESALPFVQIFVALKSIVTTFSDAAKPVIQYVIKPMVGLWETLAVGIGKMSPVLDILEPVIEWGTELISNLAWLECPDWMGWLCDLDEIIEDFLLGALQALGIDLRAMLDRLTDEVLKFLKLPTVEELLALFNRDYDIFKLEWLEDLFNPLREITDNLIALIPTGDFMQAHFNDDGVADFNLGTGSALELHYASARGSNVTLECPLGSFPYIISAGRRSFRCNRDLSTAADRVYNWNQLYTTTLRESTLEIDSVLLGGQACSDDDNDIPSDAMDNIVSKDAGPISSLLSTLSLTFSTFVCADQADLRALEALPKLQLAPENPYCTRLERCGPTIECPIGKVILFDTIRFKDRRSRAHCDDKMRVCDGLNKCTFPVFNERIPPPTPLPADYDFHDSNCCAVDIFDTGGCAQSGDNTFTYMCVDPERDMSDPNDKSVKIFLNDLRSSKLASPLECGSSFRGVPDQVNGDPVAVIRVLGVMGSMDYTKPAINWGENTEAFSEQCDGKTQCNLVEELFFEGSFEENNIDLRPACAYPNFDGADCHLTINLSYKCECPAGYQPNPDPKTGKCHICPTGTFRNETMVDCHPCPAGSVSQFSVLGYDRTTCKACTGNLIQPLSGQGFCEGCPLGYMALGVKCRPCPANTHGVTVFQGSHVGHTNQCEPCMPGLEQPLEGQSECEKVPAGMFSQIGKSAQPCPSGSYSSTKGQGACRFCAPGEFNRMPGSVACQKCPFGTYSDNYGSTKCTECSPEKPATPTPGSNSSDACFLPPAQSALETVYSDSVTSKRVEALSNGTSAALATCGKILSLGVDESLPESQADQILSRMLSQVGNGVCNGGLWNTPECNYDGGDCCPQSCRSPEEALVEESGSESEYLPSLSVLNQVSFVCAPSKMKCRDPQYCGKRLEEKFLPGCAQGSSNRRRRFLNPLNPFALPEDSSRLLVVPDDKRIGDSVCDQDLNSVEYEWDGGDCCWQTCKAQRAFGLLACANFDCLDPNVPKDSTAPILYIPSEIAVFATVYSNAIPAGQGVWAADDNPCFNREVLVSETRLEAPAEMDCKGQPCYVLQRTWTSSDHEGNAARANTSMLVIEAPEESEESKEQIVYIIAGAGAAGLLVVGALALKVYRAKRGAEPTIPTDNLQVSAKA